MGAAGGLFAGSAGTGGLLPGDFVTAGTPSNLGKIGDTGTQWYYDCIRAITERA